MKSTLRVTAFVLAGMLGLVSLLILPSATQVTKNKVLLDDMQRVVRAIKDFEKKEGRLPSNEELAKIENTTARASSLPFTFRYGAPPKQAGRNYPDKPTEGGWMIWYWRGEWSEFYSSWDDHFSLRDQTSLWKFCGPLVWAPPAALLFFALGFLPVLRIKLNRAF